MDEFGVRCRHEFIAIITRLGSYRCNKARKAKGEEGPISSIYGYLGKCHRSWVEHSLAKHRIVQSYLETYVAILATNPVVEKLNLSLVNQLQRSLSTSANGRKNCWVAVADDGVNANSGSQSKRGKNEAV